MINIIAIILNIFIIFSVTVIAIYFIGMLLFLVKSLIGEFCYWICEKWHYKRFNKYAILYLEHYLTEEEFENWKDVETKVYLRDLRKIEKWFGVVI